MFRLTQMPIHYYKIYFDMTSQSNHIYFRNICVNILDVCNNTYYFCINNTRHASQLNSAPGRVFAFISGF